MNKWEKVGITLCLIGLAARTHESIIVHSIALILLTIDFLLFWLEEPGKQEPRGG